MINHARMAAFAGLSRNWRQSRIYRGCVAHWPMHEGQGNSIRDISGVAHAHCTIGGNPTYEVGRRDRVINLTGADWLDTGVEQLDNIRLFADGVRPFTISCWARCAAANSGTVIARAGGTTTSRTFQLYFGGGTNTPALVVRGSTTGTNAGIQDDNWHHMAIRYNASVMNFYADGRLVISPTIGAAAEENGQRIIIGARTNGTAFRLTGQVDNVQIFKRALGHAEIAQLYTDEMRAFRDAYQRINRSFYMLEPAAPASGPPINSLSLLGAGI